MSHAKIRKERSCLNCGHEVKERFCPNCGQENTECRQPFHYLFTHFVEDFTHYDGQFWRTMKNLIFKPGLLTSAYLDGKRQSFVPPVKLYIFVSFVTFLLFAFFPPLDINFEDNVTNKRNDSIAKTEKQKNDIISLKIDSLSSNKNLTKGDSLKINELKKTLKASKDNQEIRKTFDMSSKIDEGADFMGYETYKEYIKGTEKESFFAKLISHPVAKKYFELKEKGVSKGDVVDNLTKTSFHNLPKALFIYLPIFAFFLWVFHNKKKWWYFDHGVFTLHYFSFLLVTILVFTFLAKISNLLEGRAFIDAVFYFLMFCLACYSWVYFFIAHHKVYHTHGLVSVVVGIVLFSINYIAFLFLLIGLTLYSFATMT